MLSPSHPLTDLEASPQGAKVPTSCPVDPRSSLTSSSACSPHSFSSSHQSHCRGLAWAPPAPPPTQGLSSQQGKAPLTKAPLPSSHPAFPGPVPLPPPHCGSRSSPGQVHTPMPRPPPDPAGPPAADLLPLRAAGPGIRPPGHSLRVRQGLWMLLRRSLRLTPWCPQVTAHLPSRSGSCCRSLLSPAVPPD